MIQVILFSYLDTFSLRGYFCVEISSLGGLQLAMLVNIPILRPFLASRQSLRRRTWTGKKYSHGKKSIFKKIFRYFTWLSDLAKLIFTFFGMVSWVPDSCYQIFPFSYISVLFGLRMSSRRSLTGGKGRKFKFLDSIRKTAGGHRPRGQLVPSKPTQKHHSRYPATGIR